QLGRSLSEERLTQAIEPVLMTALPKILSQEISLLKPVIRTSVSEIASPLIKERIDQFVREELNAVRTALSDMVQGELKSIEGLVKEEIQQAAAKQTSQTVERLVRTTAKEQVEQTVQRLVPDLAEAQIKAEITRLTQAA
ncbi:MAG TPA: hypothetical protein VLL06_10840, partial [Nitrospiraceae bacterium]|nr:hypothetical protein [Nitrospiraceae bacterium]